MPHKVSFKGIQAITRYNIAKSLTKLQLTEKEYKQLLNLAESFIGKATIDELKKKGIANSIINSIREKPKQTKRIKKGKGKRKHDDDDETRKSKILQNVHPSRIVQKEFPETASIPAAKQIEPLNTQPKPKPRSWLNRLFSHRPAEREEKRTPRMRSYTSWLDPYVTGRHLPTAKEIPSTQHFTRNESEIDSQRHKTNEHRNLLTEGLKDISKRRWKNQEKLMDENEAIRRKALDNEEELFRERIYNKRGQPPEPPERIEPARTETDIQRRRREIAERMAKARNDSNN